VGQPRVQSRQRVDGYDDGPAALGLRPVELTDRKAVALDVTDHAGLDELSGRIGDAPDDGSRIDAARDRAVDISGAQHAPGVCARVSLEVPPRNAVLQREHACVIRERRIEGIERRPDLVRLDSEHDQVDGSELLGSADDRHRRQRTEPAVPADQSQTAAFERVVLPPAIEQRDLGSGIDQSRSDQTADRSGAENEHTHRPLPVNGTTPSNPCCNDIRALLAGTMTGHACHAPGQRRRRTELLQRLRVVHRVPCRGL
jgi:hypothetical protein